MTNPDNAIGTNAAYNGRTSVNAFNDDLGGWGRGILSGWACTPSSGLVVSLGGDGVNRDVAVAVDNLGNRTTINNISNAPVDVTIPAAPGSNSRYDAIVAYVDNPATGVTTVADNPGACGLIVVSGNAASSPTKPDDTAIRSAITADGASGTTAYYVVLAYILISSGTTVLASSNISTGGSAKLGNKLVNTSVFTADNLSPSADTPSAWTTVFPENGVYWTWYTQSGRFSNQPNQYGYLETIKTGINIYQRWHTQSSGPDYYRAGNQNGWYGQSGGSGAFRSLVDGRTAIKTGSIVSGNWEYTLSRTGKIVEFNCTAVLSSNQAACDNYTEGGWNTIPYGYRPMKTTNTSALGSVLVPILKVSGGTQNTMYGGQWRINSNGVFYLSTAGIPATSATRVSCHASWITDNTFPTS